MSTTIPAMPGLPTGAGDPFDWRNWAAATYTMSAPYDGEQPVKAAAQVIRELTEALASVPEGSREARSIRKAINAAARHVYERFR